MKLLLILDRVEYPLAPQPPPGPAGWGNSWPWPAIPSICWS